MLMVVRTHELNALKQGDIVENIERGAVGGDPAPIENGAPAGDVFQIIEIVRGEDNRPIAISPGNQQVEDLALARGVKRRGWLVQQQDVRIENQYRRKGHPLLFSAGEAMGRAVLQMSYAHQLQQIRNRFADSIPRPFEL